MKQFVDNVSQSGLMGAEEVNSFCDSLPEGRRDSVQDLAKLLVRERKLTKYQAQIIYQGKHQGLKFGEYTILDKLGEGGMGVVLRARHGRMEREVAIKVLPAKSLTNEEAVNRFYKEVRAAARLIHPNIVTAFDASENAGTHYLVLEFVDGKDLSQILSESGRLPVAQAVECTIQAARGLEYAHSKGLIHRDIKPANLLLDKDGTVKILDLGLARLEQENASRDGLTKSGQIMGTVDYMSPEQARDTKNADARADIYSLGCTLYRLLTGMPLYDRDTIMNKMMSHASDPIPSLRVVRSEIPERLDAVFQKMVAKRADDRQQTMTEVIADLKSALASTSPPERRVASSNSDSELTNFLVGMNSNSGVATTPAMQRARQAVEETIDLRANSESTNANLPPPVPIAPPMSVRPATVVAKRTTTQRTSAQRGGNHKLLIAFALGGGGLCLALLLGLVKMMVGASSDPEPEAPTIAQTSPEIDEQTTPFNNAIATQAFNGRELFNGRDLSGWQAVGDSDLWVANEGILSATGRGTGWLSSNEEFSDFELHLEFRLPPEGNSGVFLRVPRSGGLSGSEFIEVQIYDGVLLNNGNHTGSLFNISKLGPAKSQRPAGEWNSMEIVAQQSRITVALNGEPLQDVDLSKAVIPAPMANNAARSIGFIGLQCLGTTVEFKNIRIRPL
ncbi:MAG: DUF1080 domain-containing protein [Planctomycetaceae bacterium]|nr:DUF1080 domain-containing protein [Planctomycetales bacterium]MCB9874625.1 DUF1080 domain-containing protein [Planctomycetaceae bacterium]MCB9936951.1 DUF1080 domain-containing protein [Planctomycetaceae bacterium]